MKPEIYVGISYGTHNNEIDAVLNIVAAVFRVEPHRLSTSDRTQPLPDARKAFCTVLRKYNHDVTTPEIGKFLNKDHSTVIAATKKAHELARYDRQFKEKLDRCENIVRGGAPAGDIDKESYKNCIGFFYHDQQGLKEYLETVK